MRKAELKALAERVMALAGPCLATDSQIWRALEPDGVWWDDDGTLYKQDPDDTCAWAAALPFTASLDAAMMLCGSNPFFDFAHDHAMHGGKWQCLVGDVGGWTPSGRATAATPALALTAAALLALAAQLEGTHDD